MTYEEGSSTNLTSISCAAAVASLMKTDAEEEYDDSALLLGVTSTVPTF